MTQPEPRRCDNCGRRASLACATCTRDLCDDCYHCGRAGKVCGLCRDREKEEATDKEERA